MKDEKEILNNDIIDGFSQIQSKSELADVLKELFDEKKIFLIGDMSKDEIKLATRIYTISEIKGIKIWEKSLAFYCKLLLSKDRKSRKEIIDAVKGLQKQSMFNKLNPMNWRQ